MIPAKLPLVYTVNRPGQCVFPPVWMFLSTFRSPFPLLLVGSPFNFRRRSHNNTVRYSLLTVPTICVYSCRIVSYRTAFAFILFRDPAVCAWCAAVYIVACACQSVAVVIMRMLTMIIIIYNLFPCHESPTIAWACSYSIGQISLQNYAITMWTWAAIWHSPVAVTLETGPWVGW